MSTHGKCAAHSCRQWATQWAWFEDGPVTAKVWLCKEHFDQWSAPRNDVFRGHSQSVTITGQPIAGRIL